MRPKPRKAAPANDPTPTPREARARRWLVRVDSTASRIIDDDGRPNRQRVAYYYYWQRDPDLERLTVRTEAPDDMRPESMLTFAEAQNAAATERQHGYTATIEDMLPIMQATRKREYQRQKRAAELADAEAA